MTRFVVFLLVLVVIVVIVELIRRQRFNARRATETSTWAPPASPDPMRRPAAGWYPRPDGTAGQQYWDGEVWTEQRSE